MSAYTVKIDGQQVQIPESDIWTKPGLAKPIIKHDGVRRLMVRAGVKVESLELVISPTTDNGMRTAFVAVGVNTDGRRAFGVGESDSSNLQPNSVAAKFPTVMAAKRAIDRMALDLLGLFDLYSEIELAPNGDGGEPAPSGRTDTVPAAPETGAPEAGSRGSGHPSTPAGGNGRPHGNGRPEPTGKQLSFLRELAQRNGLKHEEIEKLIASVPTKAAASQLIQRMQLESGVRP